MALREKEKQAAVIEAYQKTAELYQQQDKLNYSDNTGKKIEELSASESPGDK